MSRVLEGENQITQKYKAGIHNGVDLVKKTLSPSYIIAHSDGEVVGVVNNINWTKYGSGSYGNYVKIKHDNGMYTLYAHLKYGSVTVKKGTKVLKGERLGFMGATGSATGVHLHFEVRDENDKKINPIPYIDDDLTFIESNDLKDIDTIVNEVIQGKWGNGSERKQRLTEAGYNFSEVQKRVNEMLGYSSNPKKTYKVVSGDNLSKISKKYGVSVNALYNANKKLIDSENKKRGVNVSKKWIYPNQILTIPR